MYRFKLISILFSAVTSLVVCLPVSAATVIQMNLAQMIDRSEWIIRGTVLGVKEGTIQAGGGELPVVTYRVRVDEAFKGTFQEVKGMQVAEITMLGKLKTSDSSQVSRLTSVIDLPRLEVGKDYLLLTTTRSSIGLSTTVGLGQGRFELQGKPGQETAVNANHNRGLFNGMGGTGPGGSVDLPEGESLPYNGLAALIRTLVGG